jgi:hypothetical protein
MEQASPSGPSKVKRRVRGRSTSEESSGIVPIWVLIGMTLVGIVSLIIGCLQRGFAWYEVLTATSALATGIGFVAIGLLEIEWLERIIGFFGIFFGFLGGLLSGLIQWFWSSDGTLSDSVGRHRAAVYWVVIGSFLFLFGCLMALRIIAL